MNSASSGSPRSSPNSSSAFRIVPPRTSNEGPNNGKNCGSRGMNERVPKIYLSELERRAKLESFFKLFVPVERVKLVAEKY